MKGKKTVLEWMKQHWIRGIIVPVLGLMVLVPVLINVSYPQSGGVIKTWWGAADVLAYWGGCLSFLGTVVLGCVSVWQTKRANDMNQQLIKLQEFENACIIVRKRVISFNVAQSNRNSIPAEWIDSELVDCRANKKENISLDVCFELKNEGKYPITQLYYQISRDENDCGQEIGIEYSTKEVSFSAGKAFLFQIYLPILEQGTKYKLKLIFINLVGHKAEVVISDVQQPKDGDCPIACKTYNFRTID